MTVKTGQLWDALKKNLRDYLGIFPNMGGGGLPKSQNFCKFTKYFFVCQIHSEVLKHVLQKGGGDIRSILSHLISFIPEKKREFWEFGKWARGGVPYSQ